MSSAEFVQVVVGGLPYSVAVSDIEKFPGSFFECMIKKEWMSEQGKPVVIERDGALFKYVSSFLVTGCLPRDELGQIALDAETLLCLKVEADFFSLDALSKECNITRKKSRSDLEGYITIRKYLAHNSLSKGEFADIDYASDLVRSLKDVWAPFCLSGKVDEYGCRIAGTIYMNSTAQTLQVEELIAAATQSAFGRGTETVTDTSVRNSFEIPASDLNEEVLKYLVRNVFLQELSPCLSMELRPYKLVIYKEGGHFHEHRDTVRGEGHIGTLVVILNSYYEGGELEISHNGHTETITGAYSWVAMYGDCLHKINPVTSGNRVSLIYDIYGTPCRVNDYEEEIEFWEHQRDLTARPVDNARGLTSNLSARIKTSLQEQLTTVDSVIITLQHLYPECQTSPAFLKGGDRALFDLLSAHFDVQVVATTIFRTHDRDEDGRETSFSLFNGATTHVAQDCADAGSPAKKRRVSGTPRLLITTQFDTDGLLDYTPFIEHTGNESQAEETVYIVAGLQVWQRDV